VISALAAALIGAGGSVIGGIVGGGFAILAVRGQWKRDRANNREDRSRRAAISIAESAASVEETLVMWSARQTQSDLAVLRSAVNAFSRTAAVQSIALTDDPLRQRVRAHMQLLARVSLLAEQSAAGGVALSESARRHTDAMVEALESHYHGDALPPYHPLPLNDLDGLIAWRP
jgi:hypothetical protein